MGEYADADCCPFLPMAMVGLRLATKLATQSSAERALFCRSFEIGNHIGAGMKRASNNSAQNASFAPFFVVGKLVGESVYTSIGGKMKPERKRL